MRTRNVYDTVSAGGMDVHYQFSQVTMRDEQGRVVRRERLDHPDRKQMRDRLAHWPNGSRACRLSWRHPLGGAGWRT